MHFHIRWLGIRADNRSWKLLSITFIAWGWVKWRILFRHAFSASHEATIKGNFYDFWKHKWYQSLIIQGTKRLLVYSTKVKIFFFIMKINNARFVGSHFSVQLPSMNSRTHGSAEWNSNFVYQRQSNESNPDDKHPHQLNLSCLLRTKTRNKRNKWNTRNDQN